MSAPEWLAQLTALEVELHRGVTRANLARMEALLHPDFIEIGRSGTVWTREATLDEFAAGAGNAPRIHADRFELSTLSMELALLNYRSAHVGADGSYERYTLRASLWQRTPKGWQLRFHQGTPSAEP